MAAQSYIGKTQTGQHSNVVIGILVALFSFVAFWLFFSRILGGTLVSVILAAFIACLFGAFISRERSLVRGLDLLARKHCAQVSQMDARLNGLYVDSVACLVTFDVGTLHVDRASPGFFDVLGLSTECSIRGAQLGELLGAEAMQLDSFVSQIRTGAMRVHEEFECKRADGKPLKFLISGCYLPHLDAIEAALYRQPIKTNGSRDVEQVTEDLERFRKGMVRREGRILELKGEVNRLLAGAGESVRYQVDDCTDDSRFARIINGKETLDHD